MNKRGDKRGQVTIFIILAIVIVAVLLIIFYPRIKIAITPSTPTGYVEDCVKKELGGFITKISEQGGSLNPVNFLLYQDKKIDYLCYTNEYYKTCMMQQPFLKQHVEEEISKFISPIAENCVNQMASDYQGKGYSVNKKKGNISVEIVPHNIKVVIGTSLILNKESTQAFNSFIIAENSEMYDLLIISQSILNYEARYGDSAPETFMLYYPDLRIEKLKLGDGSKIYTLTQKDTNERFVFASRSVAWPAGYGMDEKYVKT